MVSMATKILKKIPKAVFLSLAFTVVLGLSLFITSVAIPTDSTGNSNQAFATDIHPFNEPPDIDPEQIAHFSWMQYKFFRAPDGYTAGIWAVLDPEVPLPATIQIAVPEAADVFWFGPVPEGGVNQESPQFHDYHVYTDEAQGLKIYTAVLTNSHQVQIEHYFWGEAFAFPIRTLPNGDHSIRISYTPLHDVPTLRLAAFLPEGSAIRDHLDVDFLGVSPTTGDPAFAMTIEDAQGLQNYTVEIEYLPAEITARQNQPGVGSGILIAIGVVVASFALGAGALYFMLQKRKSGKSADAESDKNKNADEENIFSHE